MKIILHGATSGSNFGDFLFADLFLNELNKLNPEGTNLFFEFNRFGIGDHFREELNYKHKQKLSDLFNADLLILFSGGYFGERTTTWRESIIRFIRYVPVSLLFLLRNKPIVISGVGGGPLSNKFIRMPMKIIMDKAMFVTVRDEETKEYYKEYGVQREITVTSDTAQVISENMIPILDNAVQNNIYKVFNKDKIVFLHMYGKEEIDNKIIEKVIPPLNSFLNKHKDFGVIIGYDWKQDTKKLKNVKELIDCKSVYIYKYENAWQFCSLLNNTDLIITPKLHVGIVGSSLGKSVISMPMHKEKTKRYYDQIGEQKRCISLDNSNFNKVYETIEKYHDKNINLKKEFSTLAKYNLDIIGEAISKLKSKTELG